MLRPGGFPEYSPGEQILFDQIISIIQKKYQQFGYTHIHTPAVESNKVLLSKNGEETGKQIFGIYGMAQGKDDLKDYALHFDLTVPFARYVLDREGQLTFPFKRFQIQPVWRGERSQKGRFKEFFQCDIDVIWKNENKDSDYLYYDAEIITNLSHTINGIVHFFQIPDKAIFHISNRNFLYGFLTSTVGEKHVSTVSSLIDKYKKIGKETFLASLTDLEISTDQQLEVITFLETKIENGNLSPLQKFAKNDIAKKGLYELQSIIEMIEKFGLQTNYEIDLQIVRGLDYYTGNVFECFFENDASLGSICGGGRYENLTGYLDLKKNYYSGVGGSIGISRLLSKVFEIQKPTQQTIANYLFIHFEETFPDILKLANEFLSQEKNLEIFPKPEKLGKQFGYADKKGIPHVVILGQGEKEKGIYKIKNMLTGEEVEEKLG